MNGSCDWSRVALALIVVVMCLGTPFLWAQTLGTAPVFNTAVPGQTARVFDDPTSPPLWSALLRIRPPGAFRMTLRAPQTMAPTRRCHIATAVPDTPASEGVSAESVSLFTFSSFGASILANCCVSSATDVLPLSTVGQTILPMPGE